ncbi:uncharacterized protein LOC133172055 isoform X2 [Saccostrea echinata]|uniref:uncharacterized protein LOC133172055 isoform X2 n=1 Tax=Saccostrea echinata TaxID=191078 RepID=UPI002A83DBA6|nr:uncharacterized protein LOC133172055 isoform X2 [Saccostrea echinata]
MAAPETDVPNLLGEKSTPAKLEELSREASPSSTSSNLESENLAEKCTELLQGSENADSPSSNPTLLTSKLLPDPSIMPGERSSHVKGNVSEKLLPDQCVLPEEPRPPWKGTLVQCAKLWSYLSGISTFERANMLRKGREVHKIYVEVIKGKTFLDDQFSYTEFGRMVLTNGTIRAGRAKNAKQIVVARETLYCSGSGACKRACGGYGECVAGCEKTKMRGHKCSYRVKLTMRLGYVNHWFVEVLGDHDQFGSLNDSVPTPSSLSPSTQKAEDVSSSPSSDLNMMHTKSSSPTTPHHMNGPTDFVTMVPQVTIAMPNTLPNSFHNALPNAIFTTPSMNLPVNLPVISQQAVFTTPNLPLFMTAGTNIQSRDSPYMGMVIPEFNQQDVPLPLVKMKKEPTDNGYQDKHSPTDSFESNSNDSFHSVTPKTSSPSRAKARKKFTPYQVINTSLKENQTKQDVADSTTLCNSDNQSAHRNGNQRGMPETNVRRELRDLVAKRELDRCLGVQSNPKDEEMSDNLRQLISEGEMENGYTYIWDDDLSTENGKADKDLMTRVRQLESHVKQLRNVVLKGQGEGHIKKKAKGREFDFKKYNTRHIALKILYLGWDYHGFAVQEDTEKTIETALFEALLKTKLIESRETSNYHRCGRTDKGVSAFGQVISLDVRTNLVEGTGVKIREDGTAQERPGDKATELRFCYLLNKVLPPEIRCLAWAPVDPSFSARFDCKKRTYKYFFPKGSLNLQVMQEAVDKLIGEHDYRNFCKMDVGNGVVNYTRKIVSAEILTVDEGEEGYQMCELTIVGLAFLWHQIRCIVALLFMIGQGKEKPEIIDELLDVEKNPRKPQYTMASELPLNLFDAEFAADMEWIYEADWHEENIKHLQQIWAQHIIRASMIKRMLEEMDKAKVETDSDIAPWADLSGPVCNQADWIVPMKGKVHKPLLERQLCDSLEDRMEHYAKRRKISVVQSTEDT